MTTRTGSRAVIVQDAERPPTRRPFGVLDELACYFDSPAEPINVHLELWLPGRLDPKRLRAAVTTTLADLPRARARRAAGGWSRRGYTWEFPAEVDVDPVWTTNWRTEAELDAARVRFLANAPSIDRSPPFRLLLANGPGLDSLILNAHHVALDGRSCLRLLRLIADQYTARADQYTARGPRAREDLPDPPPHSPTPPTSQTPRTPRTPPTAPAAPTGTQARSATRLPARIAPQHGQRRRPWHAPGYGVGLLGWPGVPTAPQTAPTAPQTAPTAPQTAPTAAGRDRDGEDAPRVTVNDLLIAALIQTVTRWNAAHHRRRRAVRISMPVDTRPPGGEDQLGNMSRLCTITADPAQIPDLAQTPDPAQIPGPASTTDLAATARLTAVVASQTQRAKREHGPKEDPTLAALASTPLPASLKRQLVRLAIHSLGRLRCDTSLLSNLGNVTDPPRFGELSPTRIWFSTSAHMPRGLSVGAVTIDGRLQLCFRYRYALLDDDAGRDFVAEYANVLSALADMRTEPET